MQIENDHLRPWPFIPQAIHRLRRVATGLFFLLLLGCQASIKPEIPRLRIASWNIQNFFDDRWQGTEYPEYDPSTTAWGSQGFRYRLRSLAPILDQINADIMVLLEVENLRALEHLNLELVSPYPYTFLLPQADQAINIGLFSRLPLEKSLRHEIGYLPKSKRQLRAIIEVWLQLPNTISEPIPSNLVLFLNHWKSRRGGAIRTAGLRQKAAAVLAWRIRSLQSDTIPPYLIALGDFNEPADSYFRYQKQELEHLSSFWPVAQKIPQDFQDFPKTQVQGSIDPTARLNIDSFPNPKTLTNPWFAYRYATNFSPEWNAPVLNWDDWKNSVGELQVPEELGPDSHLLDPRLGSYYFQQEWLSIDNILLNYRWFEDNQDWRFSHFFVPRFSPLVSGTKPNTWRKDRMQGISDHLPLVLELQGS